MDHRSLTYFKFSHFLRKVSQILKYTLIIAKVALILVCFGLSRGARYNGTETKLVLTNITRSLSRMFGKSASDVMTTKRNAVEAGHNAPTQSS